MSYEVSTQKNLLVNKKRKKWGQELECDTFTNYILPSEIWGTVAKNYLDTVSIGNIRLTSRFFSLDKRISEVYLQKKLLNFLDYKDDNELSGLVEKSNIDCPKSDVLTVYKFLITQFYLSLEKMKRELVNRVYVDEKYLKAFWHASEVGQISFLKLIIQYIPNIVNKKNKKIGKTALSIAAENCRRRTFAYLLKSSAKFVLGEVDVYNDSHLIYFDIGYCNSYSVTPFHIVALNGEEHWLRDILNEFSEKLAPDVFSDNYLKCLQYIVDNNYNGLSCFLDIFNDNHLLFEKDAARWNLLHWTACLGKIECMSLLIERGANINMGDEGDLKPIDVACASGKLDAFKKLISYNAIIGIFFVSEDSYLHVTACKGLVDFSRYLIGEMNMDVNSKNQSKDTPLSLSQYKLETESVSLSREEKERIIKCQHLLRKYGATDSIDNSTMDYIDDCYLLPKTNSPTNFI